MRYKYIFEETILRITSLVWSFLSLSLSLFSLRSVFWPYVFVFNYTNLKPFVHPPEIDNGSKVLIWLHILNMQIKFHKQMVLMRWAFFLMLTALDSIDIKKRCLKNCEWFVEGNIATWPRALKEVYSLLFEADHWFTNYARLVNKTFKYYIYHIRKLDYCLQKKVSLIYRISYLFYFELL